MNWRLNLENNVWEGEVSDIKSGYTKNGHIKIYIFCENKYRIYVMHSSGVNLKDQFTQVKPILSNASDSI